MGVSGNAYRRFIPDINLSPWFRRTSLCERGKPQRHFDLSAFDMAASLAAASLAAASLAATVTEAAVSPTKTSFLTPNRILLMVRLHCCNGKGRTRLMMAWGAEQHERYPGGHCTIIMFNSAGYRRDAVYEDGDSAGAGSSVIPVSGLRIISKVHTPSVACQHHVAKADQYSVAHIASAT
jgi:hypothetical protein